MKAEPRLSIRIDLPGGGRLGPGKAKLLQAIADEGSISGASRALEMSYPRALKLIEAMDGEFGAPLVSRRHGGASHGGAQLTEQGVEVLRLYREICDSAEDAAFQRLRELRSHIDSSGD